MPPSPSPLHDAFKRVLALQKYWSGKNTPEMHRRGLIIRNEIRGLLTLHEASLRGSMLVGSEDLTFEGRDATGNKSEIPWVRFFSKARSPRANVGWYVVYLFDAKGDGIYLGLWHASTRWVGYQPIPRTKEELDRLTGWARGLVADQLMSRNDLVSRVTLGASRSTGKSYELGWAASIYYPVSEIPDDNTLISDAGYFAQLLSTIYSAQDRGEQPEFESPEIETAKQQIEEASNPGKTKARKGQGFLLNAAERNVIEMRAMTVASEWLGANGYYVADVHKTHSYDFNAAKEGKKIHVEVKGTTSSGEEIILTKNEVTLHQRVYPNNMLIVVHSIRLQRSEQSPLAEGGTVAIQFPWLLDPKKLAPLSYQYLV